VIDDHLKMPLPARRDVGAVTIRDPVSVARSRPPSCAAWPATCVGSLPGS
jgi:hypothetical protein